MKTNHVRAKLKHGDPSIGTWLTLPDPLAARMMARVGFDWLTVELEHSPTSFESAAASFAIISGSGPVPLARVPINSVENIKRVLDTGSWGVVVPMVNSRAEAELAVGAARYAPRGARTIGGQLHAINFDTDPGTYYAKANDEILVVLMAEHVNAIEKADEIFSVPGIDVVFIGPNDLHNSMGRPPAFESDHKEFNDALAHILKVARKHGIAPGIHVADQAAAQRRMAEGFQFIAISSEAGFMLSKAQEVAMGLGLASSKKAVARY
jgi:4-hydroxy-2-oxoheptanedioate aldolase